MTRGQEVRELNKKVIGHGLHNAEIWMLYNNLADKFDKEDQEHNRRKDDILNSIGVPTFLKSQA